MPLCFRRTHSPRSLVSWITCNSFNGSTMNTLNLFSVKTMNTSIHVKSKLPCFKVFPTSSISKLKKWKCGLGKLQMIARSARAGLAGILTTSDISKSRSSTTCLLHTLDRPSIIVAKVVKIVILTPLRRRGSKVNSIAFNGRGTVGKDIIA